MKIGATILRVLYILKCLKAMKFRESPSKKVLSINQSSVHPKIHSNSNLFSQCLSIYPPNAETLYKSHIRPSFNATLPNAPPIIINQPYAVNNLWFIYVDQSISFNLKLLFFFFDFKIFSINSYIHWILLNMMNILSPRLINLNYIGTKFLQN